MLCWSLLWQPFSGLAVDFQVDLSQNYNSTAVFLVKQLDLALCFMSLSSWKVNWTPGLRWKADWTRLSSIVFACAKPAPFNGGRLRDSSHVTLNLTSRSVVFSSLGCFSFNCYVWVVLWTKQRKQPINTKAVSHFSRPACVPVSSASKNASFPLLSLGSSGAPSQGVEQREVEKAIQDS
jgi:hypothetical protein